MELSRLLLPAQKLLNFWYGGGLKENIVFVHIPKCGGISIDYAISRHSLFSKARIYSLPSVRAAKIAYQFDNPLADNYYQVSKYRELLLIYFMSQEIRFISGHFRFSELAYRHFSDTYKFITVLRNPVKRWISHFFFNTSKPPTDPHKINESITTFLQSEGAKDLGYQYVKYLSGLDESGDYSSQQAIERAKTNLHKFELVGCLEYFDDFLKQFEHRFGVKLKVFKKNQNPISPAYIQSVLTKEIEETITRLCQPDFEVYKYVVANFIKRL